MTPAQIRREHDLERTGQWHAAGPWGDWLRARRRELLDELGRLLRPHAHAR